MMRLLMVTRSLLAAKADSVVVALESTAACTMDVKIDVIGSRVLLAQLHTVQT